MRSPWASLRAHLYDVVTTSTADFNRARGIGVMHPPVTTRTVTCPSDTGSDAAPVRVEVDGVDTYLNDSAQFFLEYGTRIRRTGCYSIGPSFRADVPDQTHLTTFLHSEAEVVGDLSTVVAHVEAYVRHLAEQVLVECGAGIRKAGGGVAHLEDLVSRDRPFTHLTLDEAIDMLRPGVHYTGGDGNRYLTRAGEQHLIATVDEFTWVSHFDALTVPFYQATDESGRLALAADLYFGPGEVVGAGQRHESGAGLRRALVARGIPDGDYDWYVRMKDEAPLTTSGFGLGVERFLTWVLVHDDVRDIPLIPRHDEVPAWPTSIDRP